MKSVFNSSETTGETIESDTPITSETASENYDRYEVDTDDSYFEENSENESSWRSQTNESSDSVNSRSDPVQTRSKIARVERFDNTSDISSSEKRSKKKSKILY